MSDDNRDVSTWDIWEGYIGEQSPEDFMCRDPPYKIEEIKTVVSDYLSEIPQLFEYDEETLKIFEKEKNTVFHKLVDH